MSVLRLSLVAALFWGTSAIAHEFWIEPEGFQVETDVPFSASLRNGENFSGASLAWFENRFTRFEAHWRDETIAIRGRMGDTPALQMLSPPEDGLMILLHETVASDLTYKEWDKFLAFVDHKDFASAVATHDQNGWPKEGFRESYTRHVKALVAVGDGAGADRAFGMETEFVALTNPYDAGFDGTMRVEVLYQGAPRPDAQVEVFDRAPSGEVTVSLFRTDDAGVAVVPVLPGHDYLFDAVVLRPADVSTAAGDENPLLWETLWAALTFSVPGQ